jgi:hypothetical protein
MSDIIARQSQLIGTSAEWASHDVTLANGEFGLERDTAGHVTAKIGDGVTPWSALPYAFSGGTGGGTGGTGGITQGEADARYIQITEKAAAGGAASAGKVLQLDASGKIPESVIPDLSNFAVTLADLTAVGGPGVRGKTPVTTDDGVLSNTLIDGVAAGGDAAQAGKVVFLDAGGKITESVIPDLSSLYVAVSELLYKGGTPAAWGKVPALNNRGVLDQSVLDGVAAGGTAAQAGKLVFLDANGKVDGTVLPATAIEDVINTWASTNDIAYMLDTKHISFVVARTDTPTNRELFSVVVPTADVTLPVYGTSPGQMREGDNMRILNVNAAKIKVTGANLIIIGNPAVLPSVDIAPAGMAHLYWVDGKIYIEGEGVTASA